jgi:Icc-related predicted phosphoesterase
MASGLCFISDAHSQFDKLQKAVDYAETQNLRIIFLGDIFDSRVDYSDSVSVLNLVDSCIKRGHFCVTSNHQEKLIRYLKGNNVIQNNGLDITINEFENANINKEYLYKFLTSMPYGIFCKNSYGKEFRVCHAYFPSYLNNIQTDFVYEKDISRKTRKTMIYGTLDKENKRSLWWLNENKDQEYVRVAGHYHTVYVDDYSVVIDSGCGSGGPLSLYNADKSVLKEF